MLTSIIRPLLICATCITVTACCHMNGGGSELRLIIAEMRGAISDSNIDAFIESESYDRDWKGKVAAWQATLTDFAADLPASAVELAMAIEDLNRTLVSVQSGRLSRRFVTRDPERMASEIDALEQALTTAVTVPPSLSTRELAVGRGPGSGPFGI